MLNELLMSFGVKWEQNKLLYSEEDTRIDGVFFFCLWIFVGGKSCYADIFHKVSDIPFKTSDK